MQQESTKKARERLVELAEDPEFRPFIVGYLISALDERYWPLLVQVALEHVETMQSLQEATSSRVRQLLAERHQ